MAMSDPRNVAHDKTVQQEKKNHGEEIAPGAVQKPQPGKKPALEKAVTEGESYQQHAQQVEVEKTPE
jgi:hypothetical protein